MAPVELESTMLVLEPMEVEPGAAVVDGSVVSVVEGGSSDG